VREPTAAARKDNYPRRVLVGGAIGGKCRILASRTKTTATDNQSPDPVSSEGEEEHVVDEKQLENLLPNQDIRKIKEGHVFKVKAGKQRAGRLSRKAMG